MSHSAPPYLVPEKLYLPRRIYISIIQKAIAIQFLHTLQYAKEYRLPQIRLRIRHRALLSSCLTVHFLEPWSSLGLSSGRLVLRSGSRMIVGKAELVSLNWRMVWKNLEHIECVSRCLSTLREASSNIFVCYIYIF